MRGDHRADVKMMLINTTTDPMPGRADTNASITLRRLDEIEITRSTRSTRKILKDRKTANCLRQGSVQC